MSALQQLPPGRVDWGSATRLPPSQPDEVDWEAENRRQLELSRQPIPGPAPVGPSAVNISPETQPQFAPDPLVAAADTTFVSPLDANGEPPMPDADTPLPPVQMTPAVGGGGAPAPAAGAPASQPTVQSVTLQSLPAGMPDFWEQGRWREPTMGEAAGETVDAVTRAFNRGLLMDDLAGELEAEKPNAERVVALQREIQKNAPSAEFKLAMDDRATPQQSWEAFKAAPARVTAELTVEPLVSFAKQMFEKAPARVAIGTGAGAAMGAPFAGIGAAPGGAMGATAGFAQAGGASSMALEMSGGILEALEKAGVNMGSPEELQKAFNDPERMQLAREFAQKKAIPIAAFDTVSALLAGRLIGAKPATVLAKIGKGAVETAVQALFGMGGEAAGQVAQSGEITSVRQILAEAPGEAAIGTGEIAFGAASMAIQNRRKNLPTGGRVAFEEAMPTGTAPAAAAPAPSGVQAPWQAAREQAVPTVTQVEVVGDDVFGEPTTAAVERPVATGDERFAPPAEAAAPAPAAAGTTASVPMMITRQMEADLLARGISQQEINAMTPQQANEILAAAGQRTAGPAVPTGETTDAGDGAATAEPRTDLVQNRTNRVQNRTNAGQTVTNRVETATNAVATAEPTVKPPKKLYRGEAPNQWDPNVRGMGTFALGKGRYSTTDKKFARMYGEVKEVSPDEYWPRNPLVLPGTGDAAGLLATYIARNTNFRNMREFNAAYPDPGQFVREQGFDGIIAGNEVVKYADEAPAAASAAEAAAATGETASGVDEATNQNYGGINEVGISENASRGDAANPLESAASFTRSRAEAIRAASPSRKGFSAEFEALLEWGQREGVVTDQAPVQGAAASKGREHEVWLAPEGRVFKATYPQQFGLALSRDGKATPVQYLERIALNNEFFGDAIRIERLWNENGRLRVVTSQPFVNGQAASDQQIESLFNDLGFTKQKRGDREFFYNEAEGVVAFDTHGGNVLSVDGKVIPIDVGMQRVTPELAAALDLTAPSTADAQAATTARRNIQRKLRPDAGAIDLSIVEDLVEYGRTIYRAGMDYATWAAAMTREFGQAVAQFLRQAFDRIVAAYQASIYSDETGAVGGGRPVRFKRSVAQLEALAKDSQAFRTWFDDFRKYLEGDFLAQFPEYAPLVNEFLSATSAATSVAANVPIMVKELKHFLETGEIRTNFEAHANNLRRAVAGQKLEGPKISEYSDAVFGNPDAIPVDRHIAQIMFGVKAPTARQIAAAKRRIREIALRLNWQPRQVMAALWAANQKLNNQPSESYERHLERFKGELLSILAADRSGEGRGLQASRRIADRISAAGRAAGSAGDGARAAKARISGKITSQSGAVDLSIVEDLVEYGRTIYRAGMDYATWAAAMTREFGQAVAQFLRQAFDRIVAAYQASRFSDTTGAVGDVRPKAKPRQFEAKARQNEALAPETRARLGSEYIPISLNAQAEAAKDWINTNGLEAAKLRIAQLSGNDTVPTPVDFAIGIEAAGRLSATGDHAGAAGIVSTMSQRATSLGQTISVLAMMARLTPEGIVLYGQNIVSRYINTLPQEAQDRIKALQAEVDRLRTALADMKFKEGSEVIRSGKLGDEKIQDRIKRRVKARVQADLGPAAAGPEVTAETKARTQGLNRQVRDVLLSDGKQSEMIKQITQILTSEGNMPAAEAEAVGKSIVAAFTKIVTETRRNYVQGAKQGGGARKAKADALLKMLTTQREMTDAEFVAEVSQLMGLPGMTPALARELRQLGQRYENATDPDVKLVLAATMFERAHEVVPADFWVKVRGFAYLSMLFAPKTWIRNVIGNQIQWIFNVGRDAVITTAVDPAVTAVQQIYLKVTGKKGTVGRTTAGLQLGARLKGLLAPIEDVRRGYLANKQFAPEANFVRNFMAGVNHLRMLSKLTTQNKFEIADVRDVGARIFSSKLMRAWEGTLSIALGAGDRAFWMSQFRASLAQMQAAAEKNGEWTGQPTPEMIEAAMAEAAYAIYQNPNIISANANKIRGALNRLSTFGKTDQYGLGTGLMAFTQVPGSITLRGLVEWSPLGMIPALYRGMRGILYASSTGRIGAKFDQAAFNKEFTQALLGTGALYAAGYYLYALGIVTASREDDEDLEAMRRASGKGAYRINLTALRRALLSGNWFTRQEGEQGDVIVPYDWAQPVAITFAAGAELAAQVERSGREQLKKNLAEKAGMAAMSLAAGAKSLEELPLLSGLSSFIKTWGYAGPLEATTATVAGMPSQFVPQLVRQAGQINDNLVRETRGGDSVVQREFMKVLASVPGYSTKFPVRFDITGQAIQRYQYGGNSVMNVFFSPAMASEVKRNPVLQEVSRLVDTTGETSMVPRQVKRSAKINGVDVDLTNEQLAAYSYYLGNFTMSHFAWRMAAPVYARLPDEMKVKMLAQDITDIDAAVKSAVLGHDPRRLTRNQMFLRQALVNSPLGRSVPPR